MDVFGFDRVGTQEGPASSRNNATYDFAESLSYVANGRADMSDNGSSSLSDLEDVMDDNDEEDDISDRESSNDPDTEAETERLEISPHKIRKHPKTNSEALAIDATMNLGSSEHALPSLNALATASIMTQPGNSLTNHSSSESESSLSPDDIGARKRKRTSSVVRAQLDLVEEGSLRKRSSSARFGIQDIGLVEHSLDDDEADSAIADDAFDDEELEHPMQGQESHEIHRTVALGQAKEDSLDEEEESDKESVELAEVDATIEPKLDDLPEPDETVGADIEEEEPDAAAKSEDELAKKKTAMDALKPIEKLFAIFRDKLFDERLSKLSDELDQLNQPNPTHAEYLAMRQCIDSRRDEKIQLEQVSLRYKLQVLETRALAGRSQLHSQYFQTVRETRESHMYKLNEHFSAIQRERRHLKGKETQFVYNFNPKRSVQVTQQRAYNKEVSLLSGIARYVGFPAAPEIQGPSKEDVEADLRAMKIPSPSTIEPPAPHSKKPQSYLPTSTHASRAPSISAAESQFIESTPWANPNHPAHHRVPVGEHQVITSQRLRHVTKTTLAGQHHWDVDYIPTIGSTSTIAARPSEDSSSLSHYNDVRTSEPQSRAYQNPLILGDPLPRKMGNIGSQEQDFMSRLNNVAEVASRLERMSRSSPSPNHMSAPEANFNKSESVPTLDAITSAAEESRQEPSPAATASHLYVLPTTHLHHVNSLLHSPFAQSTMTQVSKNGRL